MPDGEPFTRVRYEVDGHVARVTLNGPEVLNAMDARMHEELHEVWDRIEDDDDVWVAVLAGAGERAFRWDRISRNWPGATRTVLRPCPVSAARASPGRRG